MRIVGFSNKLNLILAEAKKKKLLIFMIRGKYDYPSKYIYLQLLIWHRS